MTVSKLTHPGRTTLSLGGFLAVIEHPGDFDKIAHIFNNKNLARNGNLAWNENLEFGECLTMFDFSVALYCGDNKLYRAQASIVYPQSDFLQKLEALKMTDERVSEMCKSIAEKVDADHFATVKKLLEGAIPEQGDADHFATVKKLLEGAIAKQVDADHFEAVKILLESAIAEQSKLIDNFIDNIRRKQGE